MKKFIGKKGFSLVECLIAIAVFAIMSAMVMLLLSMTTTQTDSNNRAAADIGSQLNAILQDDEEHNVLLDETSGGKSDAEKAADVLKFNITDKNGTVASDGLKISYDYVEYYVCPNCGETISAKELQDNGGQCADCSTPMSPADSSLLISGLIANGLRYGTLDTTIDKVSLPSYATSITFMLNHVTVAGETTYTISNISLAGSISSALNDSFSIVLPDLAGTEFSYDIGNVTTTAALTPNLEVTPTKGDKSTIVIKDKGTSGDSPAPTNFSNLSSLSISFTLKNSASNTDFEADYQTEGGLTQVWFGTSSNSVTIANPG